MPPAASVSKPWNFCNVLRADGMSLGDELFGPHLPKGRNSICF